ncbi:MAG: putative phage tail protein [Hungatella sp.]
MDLFKLLPDFYEKNETMIMLQEILTGQVDNLDTGMYKAMDQCFVDTASDALLRYEKMLGIQSDVTKSDRYRREQIKAKMSGSGTTTAALIENITKSYVGAAVEVVEQFGLYTVIIKFVGTLGIPGNIGDIKKSIEESVPAHLKVIYEYVYNTYGSVATFKHADLKPYTHYEIRAGRVKSRIQELQKYQHIELGQLTHIRLSKGDLPNGN